MIASIVMCSTLASLIKPSIVKVCVLCSSIKPSMVKVSTNRSAIYPSTVTEAVFISLIIPSRVIASSVRTATETSSGFSFYNIAVNGKGLRKPF
jgi:hypothetical protein